MKLSSLGVIQEDVFVVEVACFCDEVLSVVQVKTLASLP